MNNSLHKLSELALKKLKGELNAAEIEELNVYLEASEDNRLFFEQLTSKENLTRKLEDVYAVDQKVMWKDIVSATPKLQKGRTIIMRPSLKYAAAVILVAALGTYVYLNRHQKEEVAKVVVPATIPVQNDALPGGNKATLTLGNGQKIILDSAANGNLALQGKTKIVKTSDGQLAYTSQSDVTNVYYNTVSTPKGGQYQLTLSDGTKIWMNAASVLRFPTAFTGKERLVELDGEAYFDVAPVQLPAKGGHALSGQKMPFIVKSKNGMTVQVLGTHFNIMAYGDEQDTKTTLIEGSVKISNGSSVAMLQPGQQALTTTGNAGTGIRVNKEADIAEAIAWKNGIFQFNDADLETVMRQIARWYDVDISYEGQLPEKRFTGRMSRNLKASELLSGIEFIGVHFKIEGKKIVVQP
jgi:transmembrane sensor